MYYSFVTVSCQAFASYAFTYCSAILLFLFPVNVLVKMPSVTLKDVDQHKFVKAFAAFLKKTGKMRVPEWVDIVKSARFKELAPYDPDWYFIRCAALVRHIYIRSPIGVGAVTKIFGGRKRNGRKLTSQGRRDLDRIAAQVKAKSKKQLKLQETLVL
ncbi:hypothetical protein KM043_018071 [Ampulex compressa]|nr:hypothetical protein KM043_018071 [Ampulex compressa]